MGKQSVIGGLAAALVLVAAATAFAACPTTGTPAVLAAVEPRLELRLVDGRRIRLVGLDPAAATPTDPGRAEAARAVLADMLRGRAIVIAALADKPDRWGRIPAFALPAEDATSGGVGARAIAAGLARYLPEPAAASCRAELLAAEATARAAALGLWRDPYYSLLAIDDRAALVARAGSNVMVEARLVAVEPGQYRTTLRFAAPASGARGGRRLAATIVPRALKTFEAQGVDFPSLIGRTLRLRGLLDLRFGPRIELTRPDEIEVLAAAPVPGK